MGIRTPLRNVIIPPTTIHRGRWVPIRSVGVVIQRIIVITSFNQARPINGVVAGAAQGGVITFNVIEVIGTVTTHRAVVTGVAVDRVVARFSQQSILAGVAFQVVVFAAASYGVVALGAIEAVRTSTAGEGVIAAVTRDAVIAIAAFDAVGRAQT